MTKTESLIGSPTFRRLCFERNIAGMSLAALMAASYFAFILTVAFAPAALGTPVHQGSVISWGVLVGVGILLLGFMLTMVYVIFANTRLDGLTERFAKEVLR